MNSDIKNRKPANYSEMIKKYRKISPVILEQESSNWPKRNAIQTGLSPYSGVWSDGERHHLLRRTLFGLKKSDLKAVSAMSLDEMIHQLFQQHPIDPPVNNYNTEVGQVDPVIPEGETWIEAPYGGDWEGPRTLSLKVWLVKNAAEQALTLEEKMVIFWHNLLPIQSWGVFYGKLSYQYFDMLHEHAFGNFKSLIRDLTLNPAMLLFLNGTFNNKEAPDENYGRELQELFCIGKGPNAAFTEADVQAAARVLTGWVIDWPNWDQPGILKSLFYHPYHETSDKQFSEFYGNTVIKGKTGEAGAEELDNLLDMIFEHQETALYICRRLYKFFVYHQIDEATDAQVIQPLAALFRANKYDIKPVLETLLKSEHFFDAANRGAMIKSPSEFVLGLWRGLEFSKRKLDSLHLGGLQYSTMLWYMSAMGMEFGDPPSVSGWPAYYQEPSYDRYWITTDTISNRAMISDTLVYYGLYLDEENHIPTDLIAVLRELEHPEDAVKMLTEVSELFFGIPLEANALQSLKTILLSGQQTDGYWTTAWFDMINHPENEEYRLIVETRLKATFQHLLQMGEAQLM